MPPLTATSSLPPPPILSWPRQFLAFLGSAEAQQFNAEKTGRLVTHTGVDTGIYPPEIQKGMELIKSADYVAQFYDRDTTPEMADEGMNMFMSFWEDPDGDIDAMLADLDEERVRIFSEDE